MDEKKEEEIRRKVREEYDRESEWAREQLDTPKPDFRTTPEQRIVIAHILREDDVPLFWTPRFPCGEAEERLADLNRIPRRFNDPDDPEPAA